MPTQDLTVTLIQTELTWENPEANRVAFEKQILEIPEPTDLILLPEMFTTGFTMNAPEMAEKPGGETTEWLLRLAKEKKAAVCGSIILEENNAYFNRLLWVQPDGNLRHYDKRHLFRMANENNTYSAGKQKLIVEWKGWKICPLVCYDLRFPVWSRQQKNAEYDLLIYVANWPEKRSLAWKTLLPARAIENLSYCIGVNRVGKDSNGINYSGDSVISDAEGNTFFLESNAVKIHTQKLSAEKLNSWREKFPAYLDADEFKLEDLS